MPVNIATGERYRARVMQILDRGAASTSDIGDALGLERRAMLQALRALERRGLVAEAFRVPGKSRRPVIVWKSVLTPQGA